MATSRGRVLVLFSVQCAARMGKRKRIVLLTVPNTHTLGASLISYRLVCGVKAAGRTGLMRVTWAVEITVGRVQRDRSINTDTWASHSFISVNPIVLAAGMRIGQMCELLVTDSCALDPAARV